MKTQSSAFDQLIAFADQKGKVNKPITSKQFEQWKQDFTFDALYGLRYGQSFCNHFDITDNLLYYNPWSVDQTNEYIKKNYVERSRV
jgi:hypothetical protein